MREILGLEPSDPIDYAKTECFQKLSTVIKLALDSMTTGDHEDIDKQVDILKHMGLPVDIQRMWVK